MSGEGWCVVGNAHEDGTAVGQQIIDAVGDGHASGVGAEIVVIDRDGRTIPFRAVVFEVADQIALFGIDTDDGQALALKAGTQMNWNCRSRSGLELVESVLRLVRRV
jgi:hypothetical protein